MLNLVQLKSKEQVASRDLLVPVRWTTVRRSFQMSGTRSLTGDKMLLEPKAAESNSANFGTDGASCPAELEP